MPKRTLSVHAFLVFLVSNKLIGKISISSEKIIMKFSKIVEKIPFLFV